MNSNILTVDGIAGPKTFAWAVESVFGVVQPISGEQLYIKNKIQVSKNIF